MCCPHRHRRRRRPGSSLTYCADWHAFTVPSATTVTVRLEGVPAADPALDPYLLIHSGHGRSGARVALNDDQGRGHSTHRRNSRIADRLLPAGDYTIEATTYRRSAAGDYVLRITGPAVADTIALTGLPAADCTQTTRALPDGIHQAWTCIQPSDDDYTVTGTAATSNDTVSLAWTTTAGVAATGTADLGLSQPDELHTAYRRTSRTALACTADGTATLTATIGAGTAQTTKVAKIAVDCVTPVQITGLDDTTASGTGTVTVADTFTVDPAAARCMSSPSGTVTAPSGGAAGDRRLSADLASPGTVRLTVTCTAAGYAGRYGGGRLHLGWGDNVAGGTCCGGWALHGDDSGAYGC